MKSCSIITVVFNDVTHIEQTIKSVLSQNYKSIEYIVIDGSSNDGTLEIIRKYQHNISIFISEPDKGIYDALNKAIQMSTSDMVGFLHSGDFFMDNNVVTRIIKKSYQENSDIVYSDLDYVQKFNSGLVVRHWESGDFSIDNLKYGWMPPHPTFYMRRYLYSQFGAFNLDFTICADYDCMLRFLSKKNLRVSYIPESLVKMRVGGVSNNSFFNFIKKFNEDYKVLKNNKIGSFLTIILKKMLKIPQYFSRVE
jgi:glycosyltransferase